jgi:hypothetical protein
VIFAETYMDLVTNTPHWLFELTTDAVFGLGLYPIIRWAVRHHDRKKHGHE